MAGQNAQLDLRELIADCNKIPTPVLRESAVSALLPRPAEIGFVDEALAIACALTEPHQRADCLASLTRMLAEPHRTVREVLSLLPGFSDARISASPLRMVRLNSSSARTLGGNSAASSHRDI
jgi:hypothetical protein